MSDSHNFYSYEPLISRTENSGLIRLLIIEPGIFDAPISCTLRLFELSEAEDVDNTESIWLEGDPRTSQIKTYTALSYTWGDETTRKEIFIDGKILQVGKNLEEALRYLRKPDRALVLWADAVCINQNDIEEKNAQILQMGNIYRTAVIVTVWLGLDDEDSREAFFWCQAISVEIFDFVSRPFSSELQDMDRELAGTLGQFQQAVNQFKETFRNMFNFPQATGHFLKTFSRPWFHRVWTVQEMVLARRLVFVCGTDVLTEEQLNVCAGDEGKSLGIPPILDWERLRAWKSLTKSNMPILSAAVKLFGEKLCKDPRDKIYGFLGICKPRWPSGIKVDYRYSPGQVYQMAASCFIIDETSFESVFYGPRYYTSSLASELEKMVLPTWVPDIPKYWNPCRTRDILDGDRYGIERGQYFECFRTEPDGSLAYPLHEENQSILALDGVVFSQTSSLGTSYDLEHVDWQQVVRRWSPQYNQAPYGGEDEIMEAYVRTILLDYWADVRIRAENVSEIKQSYLEWSKLGMGEHLEPENTAPTIDSDDRVVPTNQKNTFSAYLKRNIIGRVFSQLENGYFAMVPENSAVGDRVAMVCGSRLPIILRREKQEHTDSMKGMKGKVGWRLIGTAYVHGIMDGELWEDFEKGLLSVEHMYLV